MPEATRRTAIYYSPVFLDHILGLHPESPDRLRWIVEELKDAGLWKLCAHPTFRDASIEDIALVHERAYIESVKALAEAGGGDLDEETIVSPGSWKAAVRAVGAGLAAVKAVLAGRARNAFCLVRPPGHHALPGRGMGFCIFNNVAVAARSLQQRMGVARVAIFDWDAHHGNGTQEVFYRDGGVFFASIHASPMFPNSGSPAEQGEGPGLGRIVNRPILPHCDPELFLTAARGILAGPMADFKPEFILVSAGFDPYKSDPLVGMGLAPADFRTLTDWVVRLAEDCCGGRVVSFLEGGYHQIGLPLCARAHVEGLTEGARR